MRGDCEALTETIRESVMQIGMHCYGTNVKSIFVGGGKNENRSYSGKFTSD